MANGNGETGLGRLTNVLLTVNATLAAAGIAAVIALFSRVSTAEESLRGLAQRFDESGKRMDRLEVKVDRLIERNGGNGK